MVLVSLLVPTYIIAAWLCIDVTSAYKCKIALTDQKVYYLYVGIGLEHVIPIGLKCWLLHIKIVFSCKKAFQTSHGLVVLILYKYDD